MEIKKSIKAETQTWNNYDFDKPSLAAIAYGVCDGVCVLWTVGAHINMELIEYGLRIEELLDVPDAPGIWIWEGIGIWYPGPYEYPTDGEIVLEGKYREPTVEEWDKIQRGECPWDDNAWKLKRDPKSIPIL